MSRIAACIALASLGLGAATASAAVPEPSGSWLNSEPMTLNALKGKIVVLYFYEEG